MESEDPKLPPELNDKIIAFLRADRVALRACSTVCKSWLPSSRYLLFEKIRLSPTTTGALDLLRTPGNPIV
ncbi:hypothetical protein B0H19DRAFT_948733, partial [Mycena capillaripes]